MLKQLILENWKSFCYAELPIDALTVLIGTNASGKSNVVEALDFLQRIAIDEDIETALTGNEKIISIRGGVEWAARKPESQFTLKVLIQGKDESTDYLYTIQIQTKPKIRVIDENIIIDSSKEKGVPHLWNFDINNIYFPDKAALPLTIKFQFDDEKISERESKFLIDTVLNPENKAKKNVIAALRKIFIFNPIPAKMRDYSRVSDTKRSSLAVRQCGLLFEKP